MNSLSILREPTRYLFFTGKGGNNAISALPENRISQILIDRVALTAEAGLSFHNALLEKSRNAISKI